MKNNKIVELNMPETHSLTGEKLLEFLLLLKETHPKALEKIIYSVFDGEFYSFSGVYLEDPDNHIILVEGD